jgi:primase-polymerase (primpol)-like protein
MGEVPTADALPAALTDRDQWVCWRTHERNGTPTKVPIVPGTTQFASTTDPDTWRRFQTAREAVSATGMAGVGFVFTADDPLIGIDLDDCRDAETGEPTDWAETIIDQLDSYTEVSPSGTGYHILVAGTLPDGRNRAGNLELYDRSRFFTVTGDHVAATPPDVHERTDAIETVYDTELTDTASASDADPATTPTGSQAAPNDQPSATPHATAPDAAAVSDDELLERAQTAANGEKFTRLWNGSASGYESHSEADLALCRLLAFWTDGDPQRVDRLFRRSGLMRDKWDDVHYADGSTYGAKTVERAIAHTNEGYTPPEATAASTEDDPPAESAPADTNAAAGETTATADAATDDATSTPATAASPTPDGDATAGTAPAGEPDLPAAHPQRVQARRARIEELTEQVESLLAENERLREELHDERERRQALEAAREEPSDGWWPLW